MAWNRRSATPFADMLPRERSRGATTQVLALEAALAFSNLFLAHLVELRSMLFRPKTSRF